MGRVASFDLNRSIGELYSASVEVRQGGGSLVEYIRMLVALYLFALTPIYFYRYSQLKYMWRILGGIGILAGVLLGYFTGVNKIIYDCVLEVATQGIRDGKGENSSVSEDH